MRKYVECLWIIAETIDLCVYFPLLLRVYDMLLLVWTVILAHTIPGQVSDIAPSACIQMSHLVAISS